MIKENVNVSKIEKLDGNNSSNVIESKINDQDENPNNNFISSNQDLEGSNTIKINNESNYDNNNFNLSAANAINNGKILPENIPSFQSAIEQSKVSSLMSSIHANPNQVSEYSEFGSSFLFLKDLEGEERTLSDRIDEGFIPFFVRLNGLKVKCILAKKETIFLDVIRGIKQNLNITDNLGNFYQNNQLIDFFKTVGELNIQIFDRNITNYISDVTN
jgi:hypothetical protein